MLLFVVPYYFAQSSPSLSAAAGNVSHCGLPCGAETALYAALYEPVAVSWRVERAAAATVRCAAAAALADAAGAADGRLPPSVATCRCPGCRTTAPSNGWRARCVRQRCVRVFDAAFVAALGANGPTGSTRSVGT